MFVLLLAIVPLAMRAEKPKLVVNVIVSGVGSDFLERFSGNLSDGGFKRFSTDGTSYKSASYGYMQTISPVGVATILTGTDPAMHGVAGSAWIEPISGARVMLTGDATVQGLGGDPGSGWHSPTELTMPAISDELLAQSPDGKVFSIAADAVSAVVAGGLKGTAFWLDPQRAAWVSSTRYMEKLPPWVTAYNVARPANLYLDGGWSLARPKRQYVSAGTWHNKAFDRDGKNDYNSLIHSPLGNTLVAEFAAATVEKEALGKDGATDILTVVFDPARWVGERYGTRATETEDMVYRLDMDLAVMVEKITAKVGLLSDILFVITSDGGLSDGDRSGENRFNVAQFKTILNSFLNTQFGVGDWVVDYIDRQVYLNRNLVYKSTLSLAEVQNRAATFALQFRGVTHALTGTALMSGTFAEGYGAMMQRSFYPRRGGDIVLNLAPGWIEERTDTQALGGSMYGHDTNVPLMLYGWEIPAAKVTEQTDMKTVARMVADAIEIEIL